MTTVKREESDRVDPARCANMRAVRGKNTKPEMVVRRLLHAMGYRFRLHVSSLPGRPDIVLPKHRTVVLVHGCFWHRHEGCGRASTPKTRSGFWSEKFEANIARDARSKRELIDRGWKVITVWECQIRNAHDLRIRLRESLI